MQPTSLYAPIEKWQDSICKITLEQGSLKEHGTGFLVAPHLIMTCNHVVAAQLSSSISKTTAVWAYFSTKELWIEIKKDSIISSPYRDKEAEPEDKFDSDHLDFALLPIEGEPHSPRGSS